MLNARILFLLSLLVGWTLQCVGCCGLMLERVPVQHFRIVDHATGTPLEGVTAHGYSTLPEYFWCSYHDESWYGPTDVSGMIETRTMKRRVNNDSVFTRAGYRPSKVFIVSKGIGDKVQITAPAGVAQPERFPNRIVEAKGIIDVPLYRESEPPTTRPATQPAGLSDAHSNADFSKNIHFHEKKIDALATIDPVKIARSDYGGVPSNVKVFRNWFETAGKNNGQAVGFNILGVWVETHGYNMPSQPDRNSSHDNPLNQIDMTGEKETDLFVYPAWYIAGIQYNIDHFTIVGKARAELIALMEAR